MVLHNLNTFLVLFGSHWGNLRSRSLGGYRYGDPFFIITVCFNEESVFCAANVMNEWRMCVNVLAQNGASISTMLSVNRDTNRMDFAPKFRIGDYSCDFVPRWISTPIPQDVISNWLLSKWLGYLIFPRFVVVTLIKHYSHHITL